MNLPNKLTTGRMVMVPFLVLFMVTGYGGAANRWICLAIFCGASITDWLDGYIARRDHLVTSYGKFMDPLADKLLVCSAMICLVGQQRLPSWVAAIIIGREFIISGFRLIAAENGIVIAANLWGKAKTVVQMMMIILLLLDWPGLQVLETAAIYLSVLLTIVSLVTYIYQNKKVLSMQE
ncbi:MAG: CDP-diacylglycerol--glycerol-3-phosphate 3-phosphatidyltransferase [Blautia sp.]|nr:CDP-diacylglycerol--glycerol-3-phosphate 3-phosphatidyltransferase [Blautia sp.]